MVDDYRLIELKGITKEFILDGETKRVLDHLNLYIRKHEFLTLLGPSGCGKTTLLRIIAGFETPTSGQVLMDGKDVVNVPPYQRKVNTVFQRYALFPHMNVAENIAFGMTLRKVSKAEQNKKVGEMLELVGLSGYGKRKVTSLSGGEQQRVAIARALANEPEVLLLDEPLGALDLKKRKEMQIELKRMQQQLGITFVYVTHDQEEALTMSDTVVVMKKGRIQQIGKPQEVYNEPQNHFVADFIGESNIFEAVMPEDEKVLLGNVEMKCVDKGFAHNEAVEMVIRPEDIYMLGEEHMKATPIRGQVESIIFKGMHYEIHVRDMDGRQWKIQDINYWPEGSTVGLVIRPDDIHIMKRTVE